MATSSFFSELIVSLKKKMGKRSGGDGGEGPRFPEI
jgi:hypothetical protein